MADLFSLVLEHIRDLRFDLTNAVMYNPWPETWLLEEGSDFNISVAKNLARSFQRVARERALLTSGPYPNKDLLEKAIDYAFSARNQFQDLPDIISMSRSERCVPPENRDLDSDSPLFELSDSDVEKRLVMVSRFRHNAEREAWQRMIERRLYGQRRFAEMNLTARAKTSIDDFLWKTRIPCLRTLDYDNIEMSLWDIMDCYPGRLHNFLSDPYVNNYVLEPLEELMQALGVDDAEKIGISTHELDIYVSRKAFRERERDEIAQAEAQARYEAERIDETAAKEGRLPESDMLKLSPEAQAAYRVYKEHLNSVEVEGPTTSWSEYRTWACEQAEHGKKSAKLFLEFIAAYDPVLSLCLREVMEEYDDELE